MPLTPREHRTHPGKPAQIATRLAFFIAGFAVAAWAPLVPLAKDRAAMDEATLGLLLLCLAAGSIVTMPLAGALTSRFGCRRVLLVATALTCLSLPLLATLSSAGGLAAALFVFGAGIGGIDCSMNVQAIIVERASKRSMMSGFHGLFSVGGIAGPAVMAGLLAVGASPWWATSCVVVGIAAALAVAAPHLLPYGEDHAGSVFAVPHGLVLLIGAICFISFLAEGAMLDWGAVFLISARQVDPTYAGLGYACFATTMTLGRLTGDSIVHRFGAMAALVGGGLLASAGLVVGTLLPWPQATLLGYALVGAGCSNIVPVLYTAVGRQQSMPVSLAVPAITTLGYAGMLIGPAAIGFVAKASSLSVAFLMVAVLLIGVSLGAGVLRRAGCITGFRPAR